jgi:regulator of sigma E protease
VDFSIIVPLVNLLAVTEWLSTVGNIAWTVFLVVIGINALIIVHEWGHFIVARMCGVKCEKFYIWFDIYGWRLFRFKWGDTEFGLGVLPLGGYVKMLGQEDNPGRIKEELERARVAENVEEEAKEQAEEAVEKGQAEPEQVEKRESEAEQSTQEVRELEKALYAPDSYLSKSVPQRMAIIVAGVAMNVVFAIVCAIIAYSLGVTQIASVIGKSIPGRPVWQANLTTGDEIVAINGKKVRYFNEVREAMFDDIDEGISLKYKPAGSDDVVETVLQPTRKKGELMPSIGFTSPLTLKLAPKPAYDWSPIKGALDAVKPESTLIRIDGEPIDSYAAYEDYLAAHASEKLEMTFRLPSKEKQAEGETASSEPGETVTVEVPPVPMRRIGIAVEMGELTAIQQHSPAEKIGLKPGDRIVRIDGEPVGNPITLDHRLRQKSRNQTPEVSLQVKRGKETLDFDAVPLVTNARFTPPLTNNSVMASSTLGIAWTVNPKITGPGEGANDPQKAAPLVGSTLKSVTFVDAPDSVTDTPFGSKTAEGFTYEIDPQRASWPFIFFQLIQMLDEGDQVIVAGQKGEEVKKISLKVTLDKNWYNPDRGIWFQPMLRTVEVDSFGEAVYLGTRQTGEFLMLVFKFLSKIGTQVSAKAIGGPGTIVTMAYHAATESWSTFLIFLALISANLAVLNILPIPILDGGHLVFLLYEGIFRKPPNEAVQVGLSYLGLLLILALMLWAISLEVGLISRY